MLEHSLKEHLGYFFVPGGKSRERKPTFMNCEQISLLTIQNLHKNFNIPISFYNKIKIVMCPLISIKPLLSD